MFTCGEWLATDRGIGDTQVQLTATEEHLFDNNILLKELGKRHLFDDHLWFSLSRRPNYSKFTRVQRLWSLCSLLFLSMIMSAMFFKAESPDVSEINLKVGPFKLTYKQFYVGLISSIVTIFPSILIVFIFRKRQIKGIGTLDGILDGHSYQILNHSPEAIKENSSEMEKQSVRDTLTDINKRNNKTCLCLCPWWTIVIAYGLIICSIGCSGFFLFMYSLEWGKEVTEEWMVSILMSIFQSICVIEPSKVRH